MSIREMLPPADGTPTEATPETKTRKPRGTRAKKEANPNSAIAKTEGHQLEQNQRQTAGEVLADLEQKELELRATLGYQSGQIKAKTVQAAEVAGYLDKATETKIDLLNGLVAQLQDNAKNYDPTRVLADLGFIGDAEADAEETKKKLEPFNNSAYSQYLI